MYYDEADAEARRLADDERYGRDYAQIDVLRAVIAVLIENRMIAPAELKRLIDLRPEAGALANSASPDAERTYHARIDTWLRQIDDFAQRLEQPKT
jgi:hypothetical protein